MALGGEEDLSGSLGVEGGEFPQRLQRYRCTANTEEPRLLCKTKVRVGPDGVTANGFVHPLQFSVFRSFGRGDLEVKYVQYAFEASFLFDTSRPEPRLLSASGAGNASALWAMNFKNDPHLPPPQGFHGTLDTGNQGIVLRTVEGTDKVRLAADLRVHITAGDGVFDNYVGDCGENRARICVYKESATFTVTPDQLRNSGTAALAAATARGFKGTLHMSLKHGHPSVRAALPRRLAADDRRGLYYSTKPGARCTTKVGLRGQDPTRLGTGQADKHGIARMSRGTAVHALARTAGRAAEGESVYSLATTCVTRSGRPLRNRTSVTIIR
jgi:hypothetical protein